MRTTVEFDADTAAAVDRYKRDTGAGVSEAVNSLIRRGMLPQGEREPFQQTTFPLGVKIDVHNVAEALDTLEGPDHR